VEDRRGESNPEDEVATTRCDTQDVMPKKNNQKRRMRSNQILKISALTPVLKKTDKRSL